ncbi:MAG TPA: DNA methyltransferase [Solirubrobacterales bacterium]|nr:DNA methyltransferase [Solirubrobacterales bacterium]
MARAAKQTRRKRRKDAPRSGRCPVCKRTFRQPARGRRKRYCTNAHRNVAYRRRKGEGLRRGLVRLVEADARAFLASLPDECVDLIVTDPPYEFNRGGQYFPRWFPDLPDEVWPEILAELYRVLAINAHAYIFCDWRTQRIFEDAAEGAGFRVGKRIVWDKGSPSLGGTWRSQTELILFLEKGNRPGNFKNRGNALHAARVARGYPTEKPVRILKALISQSSLSGELMLDPFCGSGSTGRAARALGRRALLCDVDAGFAAGRLRLGIGELEGAEA